MQQQQQRVVAAKVKLVEQMMGGVPVTEHGGGAKERGVQVTAGVALPN